VTRVEIVEELEPDGIVVLPGASGGGPDQTVAGGQLGSLIPSVVVPISAVLLALLAGAVMIVAEGASSVDVYRSVLSGVFTEPRGLSDTATAATPLILIGLGYALAYRARVFTIGAEGQYLVGAIASVGIVTTPGISGLPGPVLITLGVVTGIAAGALFGGITGVLWARFGASIVISSLMLVYIAQALLQWSIRVPLRDPDSFVPASRPLGDAQLGSLPWLNTHLGFVVAVLVGPLLLLILSRHRLGYRVSVLGFNPSALDANEVAARRVVLAVVFGAGGLAGLAGFFEMAGVNGRLGASASLGLGFTGIIVALLGRLHPIGVVLAGLGVAALDIGFEVSARSNDLPSSLVGVIQALVVVFVVAGDALYERFGPGEVGSG
jgi:simple sugar transport system permease protein